MVKALLRKFSSLSAPTRIQFLIELISIIVLAVLIVFSIRAKSWEHAAIFFCLTTIIVALAEKRIQHFFNREALESVPAAERRIAFASLTASPKEWVFRGGSGRWFRTHAVPAVAGAAKTKSVIRASLVDPRNQVACLSYADYRRKSSWYSDHTIQPRGIQAEVLATIFVLSRTHGEERVDVRASLSNTYSPIRVDANGDYMIITTPDRKIDPIRVSSEHWMYHGLVDEINESAESGGVIIWPKERLGDGALTIENVRKVLQEVRIRSNANQSQVPLLSLYADEGAVDWDTVWRAVSLSRYEVDRVG